VLAFADPDIIKLANDKFVPVAGDDWYQRRRQDAEGEFFRNVSKQAGKGSDGASGGSTRQGIYCFTADGQLLAYRNAGNLPDVMKDVLNRALTRWNQLPEERRKPGGVKVDELDKTDAGYTRTPPPGGLILNVYTRILDKNDKAEWCRGTCNSIGGDKAARDHMWITEAEWKGVLPADAVKGQTIDLPPAVAQRLVRFHLIDNTRGEPPMWRTEEVRQCDLKLTVTERTPENVHLKLAGSVLLASGADSGKADRGFDAQLLGYIHYNCTKQAIDRCDIVAVGDHWGNSSLTRNSRPGRMPLGVVFELARGDAPADRVPPQAARELNYLKTGR
jgi:hypothetical protein